MVFSNFHLANPKMSPVLFKNFLLGQRPARSVKGQTPSLIDMEMVRLACSYVEMYRWLERAKGLKAALPIIINVL